MFEIRTFTIGPLETNCYLVYDKETKEAILIDPGVYDKGIEYFIRVGNIRVKYTVNTHGHYDHIGGDKKFGYPILIHEADSGCLTNSSRNMSYFLGAGSPGIKAHRLLKEGDTIDIMDLSFKVIHLPGHTPGGIGIECGGVIFTGDTLFFEGVGRTDIPYADEKELSLSLKKLMAYRDDTKIYPGHGPSSTIGHEREHNSHIGD